MCSARYSVKKFIKSKKFKKKTPVNKEFLDIIDGTLCKHDLVDDIISKEEKNFEELRNTKIDMKTTDTCFQEIVEQAMNDKNMFPQEANKHLCEQVEALLEENASLKQSLKESEARLKGVQKCTPAMALHGRASDLAASKIVELTKRVRELTADLEVAKLRCHNAEVSLFINSTTKPDETQKEEEKDKEKEISSNYEDSIKDLAEKLTSTNLKLCETRNQCQQLKHELKLAHKALASEVGDSVSVQTVISGGGNWRGRAQQICNLQQRVIELTDKVNSLASGDKQPNINNMISARQLEKELRVEHEKEMKEIKAQLDEKQRKFDASKARSRVLENSVSELKGRIATLLEKTAHDDQLVSALMTQLTTISEKARENEQNGYIKLEQYKSLEHELSQEKLRSSQLQSAVCERDSKISVIEEKLKEVRNNKQESESADTSHPTTKQNGEAAPTSQIGPDALSVAAEAERLRLLELLAVTNKRLEQERQSCTEAQDNLRRERHKAARLETKLAKQELDRVTSRNSGYYSPQPSKTSVESVSEELKYKIELLEEEVLFLRSRLNTVEQEKQDDLREFTSLLEDTRRKFLETIKNLKTSAS